jgi:DNA-binding SARP family transcriptional activator/Tfp pilus assembly protein PilF
MIMTTLKIPVCWLHTGRRGAVELRLLGPVEVRVNGLQVDMGHARQRAVLAILLLGLNEVVPTDRLIDRVWGDEPPRSARNIIYGYVTRLRAAITALEDSAVVLSRRAGGYILEADPEYLDVFRFRRQVAEAAAAADDEHAAALLRNALALWSGDALGGLNSAWLRGMRESLERQRLAALLDLNDIGLRLGRHHALVGELADQVTARPQDERVAAQLMLALHRSGRSAEALHAFEQTRTRLNDELGADPGEALQKMHQQILRNDPSLTLSSASPAPPPQLVPRELPADVHGFTGRIAELDVLDTLLDSDGKTPVNAGMVPFDPGGSPSAVAVVAVSGPAGVGKTALAVRWAHASADRFPDGQLYLNLRGYDLREPMTSADALAWLLRALGLPGPDIPAEPEERAARYRSLLAGRRVLLVLDNARDVDQVRPLLPGTHGSAAIVTSRDSLAGLVARDGARRLALDLLPEAEAVGLLRILVGTRVDDDPQAAVALARQCARLPLALRIVAEWAAARPAQALADLADELADAQRRLDVLDGDGDEHSAIRTVFSWSYLRLDAIAARAFRLLSLHPGADLDSYAAAALVGSSKQDAARLLDQLARIHLIHPTRPGRYGMHDLLRHYAAEVAASCQTEDELQATLTILFDYYLYTAATAMNTLFPAEADRRPRIDPPGCATPALDEEPAARGWLEAELPSLVAMTAHTASAGWPSHAIQLARTLFRYLDVAGHFPEALTIHGDARRTARQVGDTNAEADAVASLAGVDLRQGRSPQAARRYEQALALYRQCEDRAGEARTLNNLGLISMRLSDYPQAAQQLHAALDMYQQIGDRLGESRALSNLGGVELVRQHYQEAIACEQQALALHRETGDRHSQAGALTRLGLIDMRQGHHQDAAVRLRQALALFRQTGDRVCVADVLTFIGDAEFRLGSHQQAMQVLEEALMLNREIGSKYGEADALGVLGNVLLADGRGSEARAHHEAAVSLATEADNKEAQARAHHGLADVCRAASDPSGARQHLGRALALYTELGAPEADRIRDQLKAVSPAVLGRAPAR